MRARRGAAVAWLWHAAHLLHPQTWVLAILLRRRRPGGRSSGWGPGVSWLDVKLGLRMLRRNPVLTLVAAFALSIGIPASLIPIHAIDAMSAPLPFDRGDRIVEIHNRDVASGRPDYRSLHDFFVWREELTTLEAIGAVRWESYNVVSGDGRAAPVPGAEITASAFRILRVPPLMGRVLLASDEVPGAADVVVISWELWQSRFGGDPDVLGTTIAVGTKPHEVVGVMPEGFLFPWRDELWLPFRYRPTDFERGRGPGVTVFGRLADGASIDDVRAELEKVGARLALQYPGTHGRLRSRVGPYTEMIWGGIERSERLGAYLGELAALALLMIVCGNVGTLILARTATRSGEIAVRTALGASRSRIVTQLFVESLVLAVGSGGLGLLLADFIAGRFQRGLPFVSPFWLDLGVTARTVGVALSVATLCAVVAGVLPALRATGRGVGASLQRAGAGSGIRFGRASTFLIVSEVAMAVGCLTLGGTLTYGLVKNPPGVRGIDTDEYLMVALGLPSTDYAAAEEGLNVPAYRARVARVATDLQHRLAGEPGVRGLAMGSRLPGMEHLTRHVEVEGEDTGEGFEGHRVRLANVDVGFFDGLGGKVLSGRGFNASDLAAAAGAGTAVMVNTAFVEHVLGDRNPIGRRVRYVVSPDREPGPWYEIVGVVGHLGMNALEPDRDDGMYFPAAPGEIQPLWMAVRLGADPLAFVPRLRRIAGEVDPEAMILYPRVLRDAPNLDKTVNLYGYLLLMFVCGTAILLSGAGLYALMSFTVSQRTREIGIRTALGARPERILIAVARRAFLQLVVGIAMGVVVSVGLLYAFRYVNIHGPSPVLTVAACSAFMLVVGMLACLEPTLRGLRIQPMEALKEG